MKMTKAASKCAAVLCAMAVMVPAAAAVVPATTAANSGAIVASAQGEGYSWMTGDQYVPVGKQFTFEVNLGQTYLNGYQRSDFTYQWYYSDDQSDNLNWTKINGATNYTYTDTMTKDKNLRHFKVEVKNTKTGEVHDFDWFGMRTVNCYAVTTKLGAASIVKESSGTYVKIPVTLSGLYNNLLTGYHFEFQYDNSIFASAEFDDNTRLSPMGNDMNDKGRYIVTGMDVSPKTVANGYVGDLYLELKNGANPNGSKISVVDQDLTVSGGSIKGVINYGSTDTSATISTGTSAATYPTNIQVQYSEQYHQVRFTWDKVANAQNYGIAVYLAGKWRIQTQGISANTTSYTTPKNLTPNMTYKVAIAAKVNGTWDVANAIKNAVTITVK